MEFLINSSIPVLSSLPRNTQSNSFAKALETIKLAIKNSSFIFFIGSEYIVADD